MMLVVGQTHTFKYRGNDGSLREANGVVHSVERVTLDGIQVVEVDFTGVVKNYSLQHIKGGLTDDHVS